MGYEGWYPWQDSNLHRVETQNFASLRGANWATGTHVGATGIEPVSEAYKVSALTIVLRADTDCRLPGASGGQRSRSLRDVSAALCRLSYAGILVERVRIELTSPAYQTGILTVVRPLDGGPERIRTSTAMRRFYRARGSLMPSRPMSLVLLQGFEP